ncbi:MAG: HAMP domain-containing histidine kinase [Saprospiraceae bacterium]|nr:HAMP domain-containing histidine kinase [Saprospiraceae bacterium]
MKWLPVLVMVYMVAALSWWSILLLNQNNQLYQLKKEHIIGVEMMERLDEIHRKQEAMIMGEGLVFGISMIMGIYFIYRSYRKELAVSRRQNNFLLSVSHELKSPLTSIILSLETLKKRVLPHEKIIEVSQMALKESRRLENLISSILLAAKIDQHYHPSLANIDLVDTIGQIVRNYTSTFPELDLEYRHPALELIIHAEKQAIQSIVINLMENAIKYGQGKRVVVSLSSISSGMQIQVADEGIGIAPDERKRIFEKFYRVGREEVRSSKGTGLGLFIVKRLVETHRGNISVTQNSPTGTIFTVQLPKI